ncbi:MAG: M23 family metallopeptidase [Gammaproteobacteria bacterium]|uniref:M23 family metallopeptidase n=1 Tax=Aquabacterium sp. UBA2148 TaxID=1946042 RepID=UPI001DAA1AB8|nr:M23 family metallopeptidase [Aquabacterium sp. UBA2148]MBU0917112.1 M23 family metallopeptidase [Gammaproteobacteria bacterium]
MNTPLHADRNPVLASSRLFDRVIDVLQSLRLAPIAAAAQAFQNAAHRHPRRVSAAVLTLLAGSAVTAFGVAPLSSLPEGPTPVITQLTESIEPADLSVQLQRLDLQALRLYRSEVTRSADTADSLLKRLGVDDMEAAQFVRNDPVAATILQGRLGKSVKAIVEDGKLIELVVRGPADTSADIDIHFTKVLINRQPQGGFSVQRAVLPLERTPQMASATIQSSLFAAADDARIPDAVTNQIAEIFGNDIDFRRELRKGDAFSVLYEAHLAEGEPVTWGNPAGRVLAARFINKGEVHDAVWHQEPGRKGAYFDMTGRSKVRAFLSSPLAFSRVTSGFAMRFHPIHKTWRAHLGVDFGAPTGTPVRTVGEGVVTFSGWQNGYGNVVQVQHSGNRSTVYAHLSRVDVRRGERVEQGARIGAVGATGWATGPHLHFEFKVGGQQVDPMTIARASESLQLSAQSLAQFRSKAVDIAERLKMAGEWQAAGAQSGPRFE